MTKRPVVWSPSITWFLSQSWKVKRATMNVTTPQTKANARKIHNETFVPSSHNLKPRRPQNTRLAHEALAKANCKATKYE
ncbi:hypothetical protein WICPIJ_003362 [Wickerhamomyces pijperi]|uniref:Uncharacterized protein n=1 Tax=Wickerhamomyces pijperi TaxID=599730 RepID=A0A9P8Q7U0_WICPI|nr:hypothetical protein WICPIJ_003362 [Wickerhamomyces pijperi]